MGRATTLATRIPIHRLGWCLAFTAAVISMLVSVEGNAEDSAVIVFPKIDRRPAPLNLNRGSLERFPSYRPDTGQPFQVDLRSYDVSAFDLSGSLKALLYADFDEHTVWPSADRLPARFSPASVMNSGKNPGLGVRALHGEDIDGRGVGIAIIDQALLTTHREYADRLRVYEELNIPPGTPAQMHGPAVLSIAAGATVGVAPGADLYYIAANPGTFNRATRNFDYDFTFIARAIRRILEINRTLPQERAIRVISISVGWSRGQKGYDAVMAAATEAKEDGLLIVFSSVWLVHGFSLAGLGRAPLSDADEFESYEPGVYWSRRFHEGRAPDAREVLYVPMDSRTFAGFTEDTFAFSRIGGLSWAIPYAAGMYALAAQVNPGITPASFWDTARKTGRTISVPSRDGAKPLGPILDPHALIAAVKISRP